MWLDQVLKQSTAGRRIFPGHNPDQGKSIDIPSHCKRQQ